jgi:hypothetical protein
MALLKPIVGLKLSDLPPKPRNYGEFLKHPRRYNLQIAIDKEFEALISNGTWRLATPKEIVKYKIILG